MEGRREGQDGPWLIYFMNTFVYYAPDTVSGFGNEELISTHPGKAHGNTNIHNQNKECGCYKNSKSRADMC